MMIDITQPPYNADPTGANNATAAVNAAIAEAAAKGKEVFVPRGVFTVGDVRLAGNVGIVGGGWNSVFRFRSGYNYVFIANPGNNGTANVADNLRNIRIRNLRIEGSTAVPIFSQYKHLIKLNAVSDVLLEDLQLVGFQGDGIYISGTSDSGAERHNERISIKRCHFDGINKENRNAISVVDCDSLLVDDCYFTRCSRLTMPGPIDIEPNNNAFHRIRNINIRNNRFKNNGGGVASICVVLQNVAWSQPSTNFHIIGNTFESSATADFYFNQARVGGVTEAEPEHNVQYCNNLGMNGTTPFDIANGSGISIGSNRWTNYANEARLGWTSNDHKVRAITLQNNAFTRCGAKGGKALTVFSVSRLNISNNDWKDCGAGTTGAAIAIDFNAGISEYVTIAANRMWAPTGKTYAAIQKEAVHTFTPATNKFYQNDIGTLTNTFQANA